MKTKLSILFLLFSLNTFAQLPDGSIAPNITFTDIDGNTHTLYDILDEGKSVVFDVMATWCGPCWTYHNNNILESLYEEYGPNGTDEIEIFMIESSSSTNEACLYGPSGCSGGTYGDWTAGTLYPIVHITGSNGGSFNSDFNINYFPTLYKICPNRKIYEVGQPPLSVWGNWVSSCNLDASEEVNNVICYGEGTTGIDLTIEGGHGSISYAWSNGMTTQDLIGVAAGDYSCTITEGQGHAIEIGPFTVEGPTSPLTVNISNQNNVNCAGNNDGNIFTSSSGGGSNYSFQWNNGANTPDLINVSGGLYTLSVTDSYGCTETVSTFITEPPILVLNTEGINENCDQNDGSILLFANGGQGPYLFDIGQGQTSENIITDLSSGTYTATVTDDNNCTSLSFVTIENEAGPIAEAGDSESLNCNEASINLDGSGSSTGNDITYFWETIDGNIVSGANTLSPVVDEVGTYTLTAINLVTGCQSSDEVIVEGDLNTPEAEAGEDTSLTCIIESISLDGSSSSQGANIEYQWLNEMGVEISNELIVDTDQAGIYELIVTNTDNGCTANSFVEVAQDIESPNAEIDETDVLTCITTSINLNGSASSQGTQFEYQWLNEANEEISNDISTDVDQAGIYELIVTNTDNGCTQSTTVEVTQDIEAPNANAGEAGILNCISTSVNLDGSASSQGSQFEYEWINQNGVSISNDISTDVSEAGTYEIIVTNTDNGCTQSSAVDIDQDVQEPNANAGEASILNCISTSVNLDGSASSQGSQFAYEWINQSGLNISNDISTDVSEAGTYEIIVTNTDNGCTQSSSVDIDQDIQEPNANAGEANILNCISTSVNLDGSASSQGSQFEYEWINQNGLNISNDISTDVSEAGTYEIIVTNTDNGCTQSSSVDIDQDIQEPNANAGEASILNCISTSVNLDGSASSQGSQFEYEWINQNGLNISNDISTDVSEAGTYEIIVTNTDNGCTQSSAVDIDQDIQEPNANAGEASILNCISTSVNLDGSASSQGSQFEYEWINENGVNISNDISTNVNQAGTYEIIVTNTDNGCTQSSAVNIDQDIQEPNANAGEASILNCISTSVNLDGSASSQGSQFAYEWINQNGLNISNDISTDVSEAGTYEIIVTNTDNGCTQSSAVNIDQDIQEPIADAGENGQLDCLASSIELDGSNSSTGPEFEYAWYNSNNTNIGNNVSIEVSAAENYTLVVTNVQNGCTAYSETTVTASTDFPNIEVETNGILNCLNGAVIVDGAGSSEGNNFNYQWLDTSNDEIGNGLSIEVHTPGSYTFIVSNQDNGCSASSTVIIEEDINPPLVNITDPDILDCVNTTINLDANNSSSNGTLTFEWFNSNGNNIGSGEFISVSNADVYTVIVTDTNNGCSVTSEVQVEASNDIPTAVVEYSGMLTCTNQLLDISGTGSTSNGTINYNWQDVNQNEIGTTETLQVSNPGTYHLIVTDQDNGCFAQTTFEITQDIESPIAQANVNTQLHCNLSELNLDGSGSAAGANITYFWSTQDGNILGDVSIQNPLVNTAGEYNLIVTNTTNGCTNTASVEVLQLNEPTLSLNLLNNVSCFAGIDGSASININGGAAPISYLWSNGATSLENNNLSAGIYSLTATDAVGCEDQFEIIISQPEDISIQINGVDHNICPNDTQGAVDISVSGGSGAYTYLWSNGVTTPNIENLESGIYTLLVTDQAACEKMEIIEVTASDLIAPILITQDIIIALDQDGIANINSSMIDNGSTDNCGIATLTLDNESFDCSNLGQNQVNLSLTDLAGNTTEGIATVTIVDDIAPTINCLDNIVSNSCQAIEYELPQASDNCGLMDLILLEGLESGSIFPEGETMITYLAEDQSGNTATCSFIITVENTLEGSFDLENTSCFEESDGMITALPTGGTPGYSFLWDNGETTQTISGLSAGAYSVIITDELGCQFEESLIIEEPDPIVISTESVSNEMENGSNGSIQVTVSGGTPGYFYQWTDIDGQIISNEEDLINVPAGTYTLTVSDINACVLNSEAYVIDNIVAVSNLDFEKYIQISPNPTSGEASVNIQLEDVFSIGLSVLDITGKVLIKWSPEDVSTKTYQMDLADLPNGIYLVRIMIDGEAYVQKLVLVKP